MKSILCLDLQVYCEKLQLLQLLRNLKRYKFKFKNLALQGPIKIYVATILGPCKRFLFPCKLNQSFHFLIFFSTFFQQRDKVESGLLNTHQERLFLF